MAKKMKRQVTRVEAPASAETTTSRYPVRSSSTPSSSTEFNPDYSYVISDLKRIGVLAGTFITILVVLSFFLR